MRERRKCAQLMKRHRTLLYRFHNRHNSILGSDTVPRVHAIVKKTPHHLFASWSDTHMLRLFAISDPISKSNRKSRRSCCLMGWKCEWLRARHATFYFGYSRGKRLEWKRVCYQSRYMQDLMSIWLDVWLLSSSWMECLAAQGGSKTGCAVYLMK